VSTYVAGPSGAMTLAQLGADVIRIDPIGGATDTRRLPLDRTGASLYWASLNKAKRSVEVDISSEEGRDLVLRLVAAPAAGGGVLLTNIVGQSWLSYENVAARRADAIHVHILGHSDGRPAVDYTINCEVGLPWVTGPAELQLPVNHVLPAWDLLTGLHAALALLAAERERRLTGKGRSITVALGDVAVATMAHLGFVADSVRNGSQRLRDGNYLYGSFGCDFATSDGERVMVVALTQRQWRRLLQGTGLSDVVEALERSLGVELDDEAARYEYREVLSALFRPWFEQRDLATVATVLDDSGALWGRYRTVDEFVTCKDSLLHTSDLFVDVEHPGIGPLPVPRPVAVSNGWGPATPQPAPNLGADTDGVLAELLGLASGSLSDLHQRGVVGGRVDGL
jgi:2-methylfumaryl-CoA isomerase